MNQATTPYWHQGQQRKSGDPYLTHPVAVAAIQAPAGPVDLAGDRRALMIKLADRLHNTRTIRHLPRPSQLDKSRQTLDVLVPLARTLGMDSIGAELESRATATLRRRPDGTGRLARLARARRGSR